MIKGPKILITFDSIHDVLSAEKKLLANKIPCDVVPTPRHLSADCGMSIECRAEDRERVEHLHAAGDIVWRGCYD